MRDTWISEVRFENALSQIETLLTVEEQQLVTRVYGNRVEQTNEGNG